MDKSEDLDLKSRIFFYFREKLYNHMVNASKEGISKFKGDPSFHLYHALSYILIHRVEEGIHNLETILNENDIKLAVTIGLMYAHKLANNTNKEIFLKLDGQMREYRKLSEAVDFYHSAFVLVAFGKQEKALDYAEKALNMQSDMFECLTLKAWILMQLKNNKKSNDNIKDLFQRSLQANPRYLDTVIGYSECCLLQNDFSDALNTVNKAVIRYTSTYLPLIQKTRIQLAILDWDQAMETLNRVISTESKNLYAQKLFLIIILCRSANYEEALTEFERFVKILEVTELKNVQFVLHSSKLFSKICGKNSSILMETSKMLEVALQNSSENADLVVEMGNQALLRGKIKEATRFFKNATKIDETSFDALLGLSFCELIENGHSEQLNSQIEFLLEMKDAHESALLHFLKAKTSSNSAEAIEHLKVICNVKLAELKHFPFSDAYLLVLDPSFMLDVVKEYMQHITLSKNAPSTTSDCIFEILKVIVRACPGLSETLYLLAKLQYIKGDNNNALNNLEKLLSNVVNPQTEAQLLMAQIQVQHGLFERATQSLELCVSHNFKVRENPIYHYIMGLIDKNTNNYADSIKALSTALSLVNIKSKNNPQADVSLVEKASIYVELIDTLNIVGQADEAAKILGDATEELKGTPEEARILLLSAEHLLKRKNVQGAIDILSKIKPTDTCYMEAKAKHAEVLLNYRRDKYAYLQCYQDFVKDNPGVESYIMLGDAYMKVLEPDDALECYEKALKENPHDSYLTSKMGQALVETHYFIRAVKYYKDAIKDTNDAELKLQLAELYMNLREYEKGELLLLNELEEEKAFNLEDLTYLQHKTKLLMLLSQIQEKSGSIHHALKSLRDAMENQNRVKKRFTVDQNPAPEAETQILIDICMKLGELAILVKNNDQAVNFYKEGLDISPNNVTILIALAKLYMQMNFLELCQQTCSSILRINPENETASVMMADIAFRKVDFDMALFHFTQLVTKQPTNWDALKRLIEILRRTGNIGECPEYLNAAEQQCVSPLKEPKYLFCLAMYQWYSGNLNGALKNFNGARQDPDLGQQAIYNMIEICLNPDDEILADQFIDSDDIEYKDSRTMALKTAERLLKELKQRLGTNSDEILKYRLLSNFRLLATREKAHIDCALDDLISLASEPAYKDNIGITLGIATAYTILKQVQRAKNQLKRIVKSTWTFEDAEYLERCWLLLADYYIQSAKYDMAAELINKVVQHNKSFMKAYEYLGFISEKEQHYKNAASHYEQTWKLGGKTNPAIGFKLSYCLMKCKKYPDAVDVAQDVLKISPEYPRIKKDILDKCMNNLRI